MRPRVTAIVVAQNAADALARTLPALAAQTRAPERRVFVAIGSTDDTAAVLRAAAPDIFLELPERTSFGDAVRAAVTRLKRTEDATCPGVTEATEATEATIEAEQREWLWLLAADNAPEPDALEELLDTTERNPSLQVTGPKLVRADDPAVLDEYGESVTASGIAVRLHQDALDQGQFEHLSDVLGVAAGGMLIRRDTWDHLGGFDPGLDAVDDSLDFCVRTWLSGGRVILTPRARVETLAEDAPGTSRYGRRVRGLARYRIHRQAQLHRNLVWASRGEFVFAWLALLPSALLRAVLHLLRKHPGRILPDLRAALTVLFGGTHVGAARRRFRATATQSTNVLDQLRMSPKEWRKRQANRRDEYRALTQASRDRYNFITGGGGWLLVLASIAAIALWFPLIGAGALSGGHLLPLSSSIGELWGSTGYGPRGTGGNVGVADPFNLVLAVLGTLTFWNPSLSIVLLWFAAIPLAAVGGWFLAARFTRRAWLRFVLGLLWMAAPPLHLALAHGQLTGVLVHLALPWLFFTTIAAARSWAAAAAASLLALVVAACSPALLPALALLWFIAVLFAGRGWARLIFTPIPTAVLFLPLIATQFNRGRPLAIFADPGAPVVTNPVHGWHAVTLYSQQPALGWAQWLADLGVGWNVWLVLALLLAPLALLALLGLAGSGWRVALAGILIAALGFVTAGVAGGFAYATTAGTPVTILVGSAQSLGFLGLCCAALAGAVAIGAARIPATVLALLGVLLLVSPVAPAQLTGLAEVAPSDGRTLPAIVDAQGRAAPQLGTIIITPTSADSVTVDLVRGDGERLNRFSTIEQTNPDPTDRDEQIANLAVSFLSSGESNPTEQLHELGVGFIVVQPAISGGGALEQRLVSAMTTNEALTAAGETGEHGTVFQVVNAAQTPTDRDLAGALGASNWAHALGRAMLVVQLAVLLFVVLLALPTGGLEARARASRKFGAFHWEDMDAGRDTRDEFAALSAERVDVYSDATGSHTEEDDRA